MVLTSSLKILWIYSIEMVAMESSLTSFTPLGLTFGILLMSFMTFSFSFEEINYVPESPHDILFTSADGVFKFDVVPRFSCMVFVLVDFSEVLVVIPRAASTSVVLE